MKSPLLKHCCAAQEYWVPSQVMELLPTLQVVVPLQDNCCDGAEQLSIQHDGGGHS